MENRVMSQMNLPSCRYSTYVVYGISVGHGDRDIDGTCTDTVNTWYGRW